MTKHDKNKKLWEHTGGGTAFNGSKYPCDDEYENIETKQRFTVFCTLERHFNMPEAVRKPSDLTRLVGVSHIEWPIH